MLARLYRYYGGPAYWEQAAGLATGTGTFERGLSVLATEEKRMEPYDSRRVTLDPGLTTLALHGLEASDEHYPLLARVMRRRRRWAFASRPVTAHAPDEKGGWTMRLRVALLTLGALAVLGGSSPPPLLADSAARHDGVVQAVDPRAGVVTLSEMAAGGRLRTLRVRIPPDTRIVRSERLPDRQVRDAEHPFRDSSIGVADIRPGDFLVVELAKPGKPDVARSVMVTLEPSSK